MPKSRSGPGGDGQFCRFRDDEHAIVKRVVFGRLKDPVEFSRVQVDRQDRIARPRSPASRGSLRSPHRRHHALTSTVGLDLTQGRRTVPSAACRSRWCPLPRDTPGSRGDTRGDRPSRCRAPATAPDDVQHSYRGSPAATTSPMVEIGTISLFSWRTAWPVLFDSGCQTDPCLPEHVARLRIDGVRSRSVRPRCTRSIGRHRPRPRGLRPGRQPRPRRSTARSRSRREARIPYRTGRPRSRGRRPRSAWSGPETAPGNPNAQRSSRSSISSADSPARSAGWKPVPARSAPEAHPRDIVHVDARSGPRRHSTRTREGLLRSRPRPVRYSPSMMRWAAESSPASELMTPPSPSAATIARGVSCLSEKRFGVRPL